MAKSGLKHIDVGPELTKTEWESEDSHEVVHGTSFPSSPVERQLFYRDDEHKWYIYNGSGWVWLGGGSGGGMEVHGNEYHDPDFASEGALAAVAAATTGIHGVGASTVESASGSQSKVDTHAALVLSPTVHNNPNIFQSHYSVVQTYLPSGGAFVKPVGLVADIDLASGIVNSDWKGTPSVYIRADAGSSATHIIDADGGFTNDMLYTAVNHSSVVGGGTNPGVSIITAVNSPSDLTIVNVSGAAFAASYYYWIRHAEYNVPATGLWLATAKLVYYPATAAKRYIASFWKFTVGSTPTELVEAAHHAAITTALATQTTQIMLLTSGERVFIAGFTDDTAKVSAIYGDTIFYTTWSLYLLKQTA